MLTAEELHRRGQAAMQRGRLSVARSLLARALSAGPPVDLAARIEASLAYVDAEEGDPVAALERCRRALASDRSPGSEAAGVLWAQQALIQMRLGDIVLALEAFDNAIRMARDPEHLGKARVNRGNIYLQQGRTLEAAEDFEAATSLFEALDDPVRAAMCRHNRGYCLLQQGDLVGALREMDAARPVLAPVSPVIRAVGDQDRAEVLMAAGQLREGREALREAVRAFAARRIRQSQGEAQLTLATSLAVHDPASSQRVARAAGRTFGLAGSPAWQARAEATSLAAEVGRGRRGPSLLARTVALGEQLDRQQVPVLSLRLLLARARLLIASGRLDEAAAALARVRSRRAPLAERLQLQELRAELAVARGRPGRALGALADGLGELHDWQSSFGSLDLQTNVAGAGVRLGIRGLSLAVTSPSDHVLLEWSERARMLASRIQPVRAPQNPQMVADLAELRASPTPAREAELRLRVREAAWQHRGSGEVASPITLPRLREALDDATAVVAYVVTADRVVALVVAASVVRRHDLGPRSALDAVVGGLLPDLDTAAAELPASMSEVVRGALVERLASLGDLLVRPLLDDLGDLRVVLTPSGVLAGVPWALLPGLVGREVTVAQSATSWLLRSSTALRTGSAGFVAGPRVPRAEAEIRAASTTWSSSSVLTGPAATASSVSELAGRVDVLHLAAHGRHSSENPLFSGLELADGPWFGYDIDQLDAIPDVVLLSACEVGRSSVRWGEELIGMTTAWLHAGARCVIASAAAVNDEAAYDVLVAVHRGLARGLAPAAALAGAVPAPSPDRPPAPFVCFG